MIKIKNYEKFLKSVRAVGPVSTPQIYFGKTENFHPQGLFSEEIFGIDGSSERMKTFSWIELNSPIIHPTVYDILKKRIFMKINDLLSGETYFSIDSKGYLVEDDNGPIIGMQQFYENIKKIRFQENEPTKKQILDQETEDVFGSDRNKIIKMLYDLIDNDMFFINKLIVISPAFRNIVKDPDTDDVIIDDISTQYQKILMATNQVRNIFGPLYNSMVYKLQILIRDLYEIIKSNIGRKEGLIRSNMLGKRTDFSASAVITPNPKIDVGHVGIPFRMICQIFEPQLIYGIINSPDSRYIPKEFHVAVKEFLNKDINF